MADNDSGDEDQQFLFADLPAMDAGLDEIFDTTEERRATVAKQAAKVSSKAAQALRSLAKQFTAKPTAVFKPLFKVTAAVANEPNIGRNTEWTRFKAFSMLLPESLIEEAILPPMNRHLAELYEKNKTSSNRYRYKEATTTDFICALLDLALEGLEASSIKINKRKLAGLRSGLGSDARLVALKGALRVPETAIKEALIGINKAVVSCIRLGTLLVCDETIVEYSGCDMRRDGTHVEIPSKPHPYGKFFHGISTLLARTRALLLVRAAPKYSDDAQAPAMRLLQLVRALEVETGQTFHVLADSGFPASVLTANSRNLRSKFSMSLSSSQGSGFEGIYSAVSPHILKGEVFNFVSTKAIVQFTKRKQYVTGIASTAFTDEGSDDENEEMAEDDFDAAPEALDHGPWSRQDAEALLKVTSQTLHEAFDLGDDIDPIDKFAVVEAITSYDLRIPEGKSRAELQKLRKPRLMALDRITPGKKVPSSSKKAKFVESLYARLNRHNLKRSTDHKGSGEAAQVELDIKSFLGKPTKSKPNVVDLYINCYGFQDRINQAFYSYFSPKLCRDGNKVLLVALLWLTIFNARGYYHEVNASKLPPTAKYTHDELGMHGIALFLQALAGEVVNLLE